MNWNLFRKNERQYICVPEWSANGVTSAFTTRFGGLGSVPYESLNLGLHVGDDEKTVTANRSLVANDLGFDLHDMVCAEQVHGNRVAVVGDKDRGRGTLQYCDALSGFDAMVTNCPGIFLTEFYADCIPLYFFDPVRRAVGLAHSGWKGTVLGIAAATLNTMRELYESDASDIEVFIGPGVGPECYIIDDRRKAEVERVFTFAEQIIYPIDKQGYKWDLHTTNHLLLRELGIRENHILTCQLCTSCHQDLFFSYRADGGTTGRMAAILGLID